MTEPSVFIVSAPSGAGKTSLLKALLEAVPQITVAVSHSTRPIRSGERDGVDYYFIQPAVFQRMAAEGAFLEHARVFDYWYGTSRLVVEHEWAQGKDVILEIDWQGARQIRERLPQCVSVFILPPSLEALHCRLTQRGEDEAAVIARRMRDAANEISHYAEYDYLIVNDDFGKAVSDLQAIVQARRLRSSVQKHALAHTLRSLMARSPLV
ncbi:MAG: guanylate kinase [Gammaproteobacteria bacterium]